MSESAGEVRPGGMQHNEGKEINKETKRASQSQEMALVTVDQLSNQTKKQTPQNKHKETLKQKKLKRKLSRKAAECQVDTTCSKSGIQHKDQIGISDSINSFIKKTKEFYL